MKRFLLSFSFFFLFAPPSFSEVYVVRKGDSLYKIAKKFHTSVLKIKRANHLRSSLIRPGQRLYIPTRFHTVSWYRKFKPRKSLETISFLEESVEGQDRIVSGELYPLTDVVYRESEELSSFLSTPLEVKGFSFDNWNLSILNDPKYRGTFLRFLADILKNLKNTPYVFGGANPRFGLDCSSFTAYIYKKLGIKLPRTARAQFNVGIPVDKRDLKVGDLVFFRTYASYPSHVGIYIGNGKFVHFSSAFHGLAISSINSRYFKRRFIGARRVLSEGKIKAILFAQKNKREVVR